MKHRPPAQTWPPPPARRDGPAWTPPDVPPDRLAVWVDAGLVDPPRPPGPDGPELDVRDATLLRSLCDPDAGDPRRAGGLRRTLDRVRAWLPADAGPPADVTLVDGGDGLLVRLDDGSLADPSGQFRLAPGRAVAPPARLGPATAADWHENGVHQDLAGDPAAAADSYARALLLGGPDAQLAFDLAHALAAAGHPGRAAERYRQVVELDPLRQDAWVNLGDALLSDGRADEAVAALRRALDLDPDDPAAHYDLADAFDLLGRPDRAAPHWAAFLRLTTGPREQVDHARSRMTTGRALG